MGTNVISYCFNFYIPSQSDEKHGFVSSLHSCLAFYNGTQNSQKMIRDLTKQLKFSKTIFKVNKPEREKSTETFFGVATS